MIYSIDSRSSRQACVFALLFALLSFLPAGFVLGESAEAYKWSVQYLIDQSQPVFGRSQLFFPRHNRGLALSPDGRFLYAGYNRSSNHPDRAKPYEDTGEVRKIDLRIADYEKATVHQLIGPRGKAIAVDDEGHVYLAEGSSIDVYDSDLANIQTSIQTKECEGVAVTRERGSLVLYGSDRKAGTLSRWVLEKKEGQIFAAKAEGLAKDGQVGITGAKSLRGIAIDSKGRIWMADAAADKIFRIDRDGTNLASVDVKTPLYIAFDGAKCFVTQDLAREITILDENMTVTGSLSVPWEELEVSPLGNNHQGALSGIAVLPGGKGFFVANEGGQTANQKSTYGRPDKFTDFVGGKLYIDCTNDDNEPIFHAVPVTSGE